MNDNKPSNEIPDIGGEPMGSFHPPAPTKPAFDGLTRGDYFARKAARQKATKVKVRSKPDVMHYNAIFLPPNR